MVEEKKILIFLRRHPKQLFSAREIAEILERTTERGIKSMQSQMKRLAKNKEIKAEKINKMLASKIYGQNYKRGFTLYYFERELPEL